MEFRKVQVNDRCILNLHFLSAFCKTTPILYFQIHRLFLQMYNTSHVHTFPP